MKAMINKEKYILNNYNNRLLRKLKNYSIIQNKVMKIVQEQSLLLYKVINLNQETISSQLSVPSV